MIQNAIDRVQQMEEYFDILQKILDENPDVLLKNSSVKMMLQILIQYYEGGQWLQDYELDEKGLLPKDLKRGILAQDSVYELLERIEKL